MCVCVLCLSPCSRSVFSLLLSPCDFHGPVVQLCWGRVWVTDLGRLSGRWLTEIELRAEGPFCLALHGANLLWSTVIVSNRRAAVAALNFTGSPHSAKQSEGEQVIQERRETPETCCLPFLFFPPLFHRVWWRDRNYRFLALPNFPFPFLSLPSACRPDRPEPQNHCVSHDRRNRP